MNAWESEGIGFAHPDAKATTSKPHKKSGFHWNIYNTPSDPMFDRNRMNYLPNGLEPSGAAGQAQHP